MFYVPRFDIKHKNTSASKSVLCIPTTDRRLKSHCHNSDRRRKELSFQIEKSLLLSSIAVTKPMCGTFKAIGRSDQHDSEYFD